jgi:hypothetical protein
MSAVRYGLFNIRHQKPVEVPRYGDNSPAYSDCTEIRLDLINQSVFFT